MKELNTHKSRGTTNHLTIRPIRLEKLRDIRQNIPPLVATISGTSCGKLNQSRGKISIGSFKRRALEDKPNHCNHEPREYLFRNCNQSLQVSVCIRHYLFSPNAKLHQPQV
ncbi:hypothetical protein Pst134EA_031511 [Puccinia striiformis f. sp. tritici]|uniref:uncharacterized protein n=1 Tax=Puccinia striiformis f. sp. tritici TaxID=168172 RepID=UPI0020087CE9|nr:uncharacterized protein Pst134EA_031511 [Puccinia striiformis f. sp. tritici]KAH9445257.1 hypothetical protein Pst134EA_031511 [Puccinia striiformis f. sp. tritici]